MAEAKRRFSNEKTGSPPVECCSEIGHHLGKQLWLKAAASTAGTGGKVLQRGSLVAGSRPACGPGGGGAEGRLPGAAEPTGRPMDLK